MLGPVTSREPQGGRLYGPHGTSVVTHLWLGTRPRTFLLTLVRPQHVEGQEPAHHPAKMRWVGQWLLPRRGGHLSTTAAQIRGPVKEGSGSHTKAPPVPRPEDCKTHSVGPTTPSCAQGSPAVPEAWPWSLGEPRTSQEGDSDWFTVS